jgi:hypothetical protein
MPVKAVLAVALILLVPLSAVAADVPPIDETPGPAEQPTEAAEILTIGAGMMVGLANVTMISSGSPSYLLGGVGVGLGLASFALTAVENPAHETGLFVSGAFAIATGLVTMRYRHQLNQQQSHARIEPTWNDGGPAMALVIDF